MPPEVPLCARDKLKRRDPLRFEKICHSECGDGRPRPSCSGRGRPLPHNASAMIRSLVHSVIHDARVTRAGTAGLRIDAFILRTAEILPFEEVEIVNKSTGVHVRTWIEPADEGSAAVEVPGGARARATSSPSSATRSCTRGRRSITSRASCGSTIATASYQRCDRAKSMKPA
jgi:aspartate decarboxylase